jgi:predicted phosphodiesterase
MTPNRRIGLAIRAVAAAVIIGITASAHGETFAWVQLGDHDRISARVIVDDGHCPTLLADGTALEVTIRSDRTKTIGNVPPGTDLNTATVCEAEVPPAATSLLMSQDRAAEPPIRSVMPLPRREIRRIVIFGDSGCRIKRSGKGLEQQDCNNADAWPYAKVAAHAAAAKPDLVIHVGDYHYRENECPDARACGTTWGYGLDAWKSDFFGPSRPLFEAAPWIMVRGNHEDCDRAGEGWFRFLDHGQMPIECRDLTGFFVVNRPGLGFVVMDNAHAEEPTDHNAPTTKSRLIDDLRNQYRKIANEIPPDSWLLSHRPLNALRFGGKDGYASDNDIQQRSIGPELSPSVRMIVSGHIHMFEALNFNGSRPPQLVVGTGGDNLEDIPPQRSKGVDINHARVNRGLIFPRFGYMIWDKDGAAWAGTFFSEDGRPLARCTLQMRRLACNAEAP